MKENTKPLSFVVQERRERHLLHLFGKRNTNYILLLLLSSEFTLLTSFYTTNSLLEITPLFSLSQ